MALTTKDGKLLLRDGKLATEQACCCGGCVGSCSNSESCGEFCECLPDQCGCVDGFSECVPACGTVNEPATRVTLAMCPSFDLGTAPNDLATAVGGWMSANGYSDVTVRSYQCPNEPFITAFFATGCCPLSLQTDSCLYVFDLAPEEPATGLYNAIVIWDEQAGGNCGTGFSSLMIPACAENPLP